ncbi:type I-D CRISPR-associated protein Cas5/Csc1 [Salinigranum rubrum]|uniref:Type I-D CRISPR-associated protein Cas5/Csc1 n=1 Tax=Salinigranum rubrum TaxID=755307 RepID=A0A2I8VLT9_9EURY|nr:type I-D CRISPR-associated protein Cas5/Csc1 [Salinigranum rubrum]AUV82903.1 type I-D CRISPR-associated protein Cas5/Csc1 [Salinigranum rubrum]
MQVIEATMLTHGKVGFASREVGRMADTEPCVLNTALHYALGLASGRYVDASHQPTYIEDTAEVVNDLYVTPAIPAKEDKRGSVRASFITTVRNARGDKYATPNYSAQDERNEKANLNVPSFERERALAPGNLFRFYVFPYGRSAEEALDVLPRYIRLGKKRGKARVAYRTVGAERRSGTFSLGHPLSIYDHEARPTGGVIMKQLQPTPLVYEGEFDTDHYAIDSPFSESSDYEARICYPADAKFLLQKRSDV